MNVLSSDFLSSLLAIVMIDLVLAGDNALVIGLAARTLPKKQQNKVIVFGTIGAIMIRAILTFVVVWLLKIPGLLVIGGILLIWIAYKLLTKQKSHKGEYQGGGFWSAIKTIIIADAVMGLDNVIAVAGAAHGNFILVIIGLLISVPIVIWGSTFIVRWVERYPLIIYLGAGILVWTAAKMILTEPLIMQYAAQQPLLKWAFSIILIVSVIFLGRKKNQQKAKLYG